MPERQQKSENVKSHLGKPLDQSALTASKQFASNLHDALLAEANRLSKEEYISEEDLNLAYNNLSYPEKDSLQFADAQAVISRSLRENRIYEWFASIMAISLFLVGLFLLIYGVTNSEGAVRIAAFLGGAIVELLIILPFRVIVNSRRENIALRMLGLILSRVDDPKKLAPLLKDTFYAVVLGKAEFDRK